MNTNRKVFFTDLDDTLLNSEKQISPENAAAIEAALAQGHQIVICTGRPLLGAIPQIEELGLNKEGCYAITYNGGLIYDSYNRKTIFKKSISLDYTKYIFQKAKEFDLYCQTYDDTYLIAPQDSPYLQYYVNSTHMTARIDPDCPDNLTEEPVKILIIDDPDCRKANAYRKAMSEWAKGKVEIFYSSPIYLEHVAVGISKGEALRWLCDYLDIPLENTVAAGDAENDAPMLAAAHIGAAMANAVPVTKAAADYITENDCNHSGVAEILRKFVLN